MAKENPIPTEDVVKDSFNAEAVDNSLQELVRLLARQAAECDYQDYIQSQPSKPKDGP